MNRVGKTQAMLEAVATSGAERIFVFAHDLTYAIELHRRLQEMVPGVSRHWNMRTRDDGRTIRFASIDAGIDALRGQHGVEVHVDHYVHDQHYQNCSYQQRQAWFWHDFNRAVERATAE